jgi:hypothetical protein
MSGPRGKVLFKETDLRRVIRAYEKEGRNVRTVMEGGRVIFEPLPSEGASGESVQANPWDEVLSDAPNEKRAS